ncbi:hypothetical protein TNCV_2722181 [Trichonephila clavipes]|nr:hypothetical protein TNCV_2722181 [Trichonephila clavipes]
MESEIRAGGEWGAESVPGFFRPWEPKGCRRFFASVSEQTKERRWLFALLHFPFYFNLTRQQLDNPTSPFEKLPDISTSEESSNKDFILSEIISILKALSRHARNLP